MLKKMFVILSLVLFLPVAACNTVEGLGEDTAAAGNAIDREASENKGY